MHATLPLLEHSDFPVIHRSPLETLQVNLGYRCNQSCLHCHVNAGPNRKEMMTDITLAAVIDYLETRPECTLDVTGGAPELHPGFRRLVSAARHNGMQVIDRCNLTVLREPGQQDTAAFLAENQVEIVASLPCYLKDNVDAQRGDGTFITSIEVLRELNELGYGQEQTGLQLTLVYNPQGPVLPPPQQALEQDYRKHLADAFDVRFNRLLTITNMPIHRFGSTLVSKGKFNVYMALLRDNYRAENLDGVMCRSLLSIDWQGYVYDCDFNQMLGLHARTADKTKLHISNLPDTDLDGNEIMIANHCYGCTAGQGSSCSGALSSNNRNEE
ncbi:MAG: arsenosugar biosynthesis radical SAM (seleno)protein ArsS [Thiohalobacterales bacterium]